MEEYIYVLVEWPEVQELMEEEWFWEEAILCVDTSSAYFIPINRISSIKFTLEQQSV